MFKTIAIAATSTLMTLSSANAATFTSEATFLGAAGGGLAFEGFEGTPNPATATSLGYGPVTVSCTASQFCPGFFGTRSGFQSEGQLAVYFATPSSMVFTFANAITHFGIDIIGAGTTGATDVSLTYNGPNGSTTVLYPALTGGSNDVNFAGLIDLAGFTTVTFSATAQGDGIDFDRLQFKTGAVGAIPEPASWGMMIFGFGAVGLTMRRRGSVAVKLARA